MLKDQLKKLFAGYEPDIQAVIESVLSAEQDHISEERPRLKDDIDYVINLVATKKLKKGHTTEARRTSSMKLERITLENFRQFSGKQRLEFALDEKRRVTVIHGANGAGKTSLFLAINWCLYGRTVEKIKVIDNVGELSARQLQAGSELASTSKHLWNWFFSTMENAMWSSAQCKVRSRMMVKSKSIMRRFYHDAYA